MSVDEWFILMESGLGARTRGRNGSCACEVPKRTLGQVTKVWCVVGS